MLIHSYLKANNKDILCTKCIYERNLHHTQIEIVQSVVKDIKESIESTRVMILYRRAQLCQGLKYLQRMQKGNREVIEGKLQEHLAKIRKVVDSFEDKMQA